MTDQLSTQLEAADHALEDVIETLHARELTGFCGLQDELGHMWAGKVDEVQHIRTMLLRIPFSR